MAARRPSGARATGGAAPKRGSALSKGTEDLLQKMMKDAKLTPFQQRQLASSAMAGAALPQRVNPTSSKEGHEMTATRRASATRTAKSSAKTDPARGGIRTQAKILSTDPYNREQFKPKDIGPSRDSRRQELADVMAFGKDAAEAKRAIMLKHKNGGGALRKQAEPVEPEVDHDLFDTLMDEIDERRNFLQQMEKLGKGKQYRAQISMEISQRIRQLELIDQSKTAELHALEAKVKAATRPT